MLKLSKKIDYGLILLQELSHSGQEVSAREISTRHNLPQPMVANILKSLAGARLLISTRGAQGGYQLARPSGQITLRQIVEALEGPFNLVDCVAGPAECERTQGCPNTKPLAVVHRRFTDFMGQLTLADIVGQNGAAPSGHQPL